MMMLVSWGDSNSYVEFLDSQVISHGSVACFLKFSPHGSFKRCMVFIAEHGDHGSNLPAFYFLIVGVDFFFFFFLGFRYACTYSISVADLW